MVRRVLWDDSLDRAKIGDADWFERQKELILRRPLVAKTYDVWYRKMLDDVATAPLDPDKRVLEVGSGSSFAKSIDPGIITSDIVPGHADLVVDAMAMPFEREALRGILLTHVFHHIPDVERFFREALRVLVPGGVISMIDVAHTPLARLLFGRFHPEGYDSKAASWVLDTEQPLGGANQALAWMVLVRDRRRFEALFPELRIEILENLPWLGYTLSGGVTRGSMVPDWAVPFVQGLEKGVRPLGNVCSLHWHIRIRKAG